MAQKQKSGTLSAANDIAGRKKLQELSKRERDILAGSTKTTAATQKAAAARKAAAEKAASEKAASEKAASEKATANAAKETNAKRKAELEAEAVAARKRAADAEANVARLRQQQSAPPPQRSSGLGGLGGIGALVGLMQLMQTPPAAGMNGENGNSGNNGENAENTDPSNNPDESPGAAEALDALINGDADAYVADLLNYEDDEEEELNENGKPIPRECKREWEIEGTPLQGQLRSFLDFRGCFKEPRTALTDEFSNNSGNADPFLTLSIPAPPSNNNE